MARTSNLEDMLRTLQGFEIALQEAGEEEDNKKPKPKPEEEEEDLDLSFEDEEEEEKPATQASKKRDADDELSLEEDKPEQKKTGQQKKHSTDDTLDDFFSKASTAEKPISEPTDNTTSGTDSGVDVKDAFKVIEDAIKAGKKVNLSVDISESSGAGFGRSNKQHTRGDVPVTNREAAVVNELRNRGYKIDPPMNESAVDFSNMDPATMAILESLVDKVQELESVVTPRQNYSDLNESATTIYETPLYNELMFAIDEADQALTNMCSTMEMQAVVEETTHASETVLRAEANLLQEAALIDQQLIMHGLDVLTESIDRGVGYASLMIRGHELDNLVEAQMMHESVAVGIMNALIEAELTIPMEGSASDMTPTSYANAPEYVNSTFKTNSIPQSSFFESGAGFSGTGVTFFPLPIDRHIDESKISTNSAISSLHECLNTVDGFDVVGASRAYLYQKTPNPMGIQDFAIPIAMVNENSELVAVPSLIRTAMNILANDNNLDIYKIPVDQRNMLRENLEHYLVDLDITPPWRMAQ